MSGPEGSIRVVQLQKGQLSLKLWEPLCENNPNPAGPPLLLLPPEFEWLDPENGPRELAELMYIGQRVRARLFWHGAAHAAQHLRTLTRNCPVLQLYQEPSRMGFQQQSGALPPSFVAACVCAAHPP